MDSFIQRRPKEKIQGKENNIDSAEEAQQKEILEIRGGSANQLIGNLENVINFFELVKEADNVKDEIQQLIFSETLPKKPYKFLEVSKKMAEDFKQGQELVFRGANDDFAVLCSEDKTYDLKEVETSNSLLLIPGLKNSSEIPSTGEKYLQQKEIVLMTHNFYEIKEIECVSIYKLKEFLHEHVMDWNWEMSISEGKRYSYLELLDIVRMSEQQLKDQLKTMPVIEHEGVICWLSYNFTDTLLEEIISLIDDDESPDITVKRITFEALQLFLPKNAIPSSIQWFLHHSCVKVEEPDIYKIEARPLVRSRASYILRNVSALDLPTFEHKIDKLLPAGVELDYSYLDGIAIVKDSMKGPVIIYLNVEDLPEAPKERLKVLFNTKPTWTMDEVTPYLSDICSNSKAISSIMVANCRATTGGNGEKVFCSLRPV